MRSPTRLFARAGTARTRHESALSEQLEDRKLLAVFTVLNTNDAGAGSLRQAVLDANTNPGQDSVLFSAALENQTIQLTSGEIDITESLSMAGPGPDLLTIDAQNLSRVFDVVLPSGTLTIKGLELINGNAVGDGGLIRALSYSSGSMYFDSLRMRFGNASLDGGALLAESYGDGGIFLSNIFASSNTAGDDGGAIYAVSIPGKTGGGVSLDNVTASSNNAGDDGGGVFAGILGGDEPLSITDSTATSNTNVDRGAGFWLYSYGTPTTATLTNVSARFNTGASSGGGIYFVGSSATLTGVEARSNTAERGGGIFAAVIDGLLDVQNASIRSNTGLNAGGGVYMDSVNSDLRIQDSYIAFNDADSEGGIGAGGGNGGGVFFEQDVSSVTGGDLDIVNSTFQSNDAAATVPSGGTFSGNGGGVFNSGGRLTISGSRFGGNTAMGSGGGVFDDSDQDLNVQSSSFVGNSAQSHGGGLHNDTGDLNISDTLVEGNTAGDDGGGVFNDNGPLSIARSTFDGNYAFDHGGGIYNRGADLLLSDSRVTKNSANDNGGGIRSGSFGPTSTLEIDRSEISGNTTGDVGGGVYGYAYSITLRNSEVADNRTLSFDGGGAWLYGFQGDVLVDSSTISGNTSGDDGGGLYQGSYYTELSVVNSTISNNAATDGGGGIFNAAGVSYQWDLANSTVLNNIADADGSSTGTGGGLQSLSASPLLRSSIVAGNGRGFGGATPDEIAGVGAAGASSFNLIGNAATSGGLVNGVNSNIVGVANPQIAPLADNGGYVRTHALLPGSPAINNGSNPLFQTLDGRGFFFARTVGPQTDIGAFESGQSTPALLVDTTEDTVDGDLSAGDFSIREALLLTLPGQANPIDFHPDLTGMTIALTQGQLVVDTNVSINGLGKNALFIDGLGMSRIFSIDDGDDTSVLWANITGMTLHDGLTGGDGGAILSRERITLRDVGMIDNRAQGDGGALWNTLNSVSLDGVMALSNSAGGDGGAIYASDGGFSAIDTMINQNSAGASEFDGRGGGVFIQNRFSAPNNATLVNVSIDDNVAGDDGGGLYGEEVNLVLSNASVSGNSARAGGGIYHRDGSLTITNARISNNTAESRGGGVAHEDGTVFIADSFIDNNSAGNDGGGVYLYDGNLTLSNSSVSGNFAEGRGGGLYMEFSNTLISDSFIDNNTAALDGGGGIYHYDGTLTLVGTSVSGNYARDWGGGVYKSYGPVEITQSQIDFNTSEREYGGGLYHYDGVLVLRNSSVSGNSAGRAGGGIYHERGLIDIENSDIDLNREGTYSYAPVRGGGSSYLNGGGIYQRDGDLFLTNSSVDENSGAFSGGGVFFRSEGQLRIEGTSVSFNDAASDGGGVWSSGDFGAPDVEVSLAIEGSTISGNIAGDEGGGVYHRYGDINIDASYFDNNRAGVEYFSARGGAIFHDDGSILLTNSFVRGNSAPSDGGGIFHDFGDVFIENSVLSGNSAVTLFRGGADGRGGALYTDGYGLTILGSLVEGNTAGDDGGGVHFEGDYLTVRGSTFDNNQALSGSGGGLNDEFGDYTSIVDSTFSNNRADGSFGYGGALSLDSNYAVLSNVHFTNNSASLGGAVYNQDVLEVHDSTFVGNSAVSPFRGVLFGRGGAIANTDDLLVFRTTFDANSASEDGGAIWNWDEAQIVNSTLSNNAAGDDGGAIYSSGFYTVVDQSTISGNTAGSTGGGVYHVGGDLTIRSSTISGNIADSSDSGFSDGGGGVYSDATLVLLSTIVANNTRGVGAPISDDLSLGSPIEPQSAFNLVETPAAGGPVNGVNGNIVGVDPMLGALADNGGPTLTHALMAGSPAIDTGDNASGMVYDQRGEGFLRWVGVSTDIGAYEFDPGALACPGDLTTTGAGTGDNGYGVPDGVVNLSDLLYFVNFWNADIGTPSPNPGSIANVTTTGTVLGDPGFGVPDANVDLADLLFFLNEWLIGRELCPGGAPLLDDPSGGGSLGLPDDVGGLLADLLGTPITDFVSPFEPTNTGGSPPPPPSLDGDAWLDTGALGRIGGSPLPDIDWEREGGSYPSAGDLAGVLAPIARPIDPFWDGAFDPDPDESSLAGFAVPTPSLERLFGHS